MDKKIAELQRVIDAGERIVFFGGAGVSTESGIPDFRSADGLYGMDYRYPAERMLSRSFYETHKREFFDFYRDRMIFKEAKPNISHYKLAEMERAGKLTAVITQNIDGLHRRAGSRNVIELHGCVNRSFCRTCGRNYGSEYILEAEGVPVCECGGDIKPDVVLYEEQLDNGDIAAAIRFISEADVLIIGGTSLVVYPAAGLVDYFKDGKLVIINKSETNRDERADLLFNDNIGAVMERIIL